MAGSNKVRRLQRQQEALTRLKKSLDKACISDFNNSPRINGIRRNMDDLLSAIQKNKTS
jgi:hypothetical protein